MQRIKLRALMLVQTLCPAEVFLLVLLLMTGTVSLINYHRPDPISMLLPHWVAIAWNVTMIFGALTSLFGISITNWLIVRIGYTLLCPAAAAYAFALIPHADLISVKLNVSSLFTFSLACLWRDLQITFTLRRVR